MIDLTSVQNLLDDAEKMVSLLHGRDVEDAPELQAKRPDESPAGRRRSEIAECSREMARLADNLALASALVRHELHVALKGAPDPVFDRRNGT